MNEREDWVSSLLAGFAYQENTPDLTARVLAQADYRDYRKDVFSDETVYYLDSTLVWAVAPQQFTWTVDDTSRQIARDVTQQDVPTNRVDANVFSTGPDVFVRFGSVNTLVLGARYQDVYFEDSNADSNRYSVLSRWLYQASPVTVLSLNVDSLRVAFDDDIANINFTRQDLFLRFNTRPSQSEFTLDLGATNIDRENASDVDGFLRRLTWVRQLTPVTTFGASFSGEFNDVGSSLLARGTGTTGTISPSLDTGLVQAVVSGDVFYAKGGEVFYSDVGTLFGLDFRVLKRDFDYETSPLDREEKAARAAITYYHSATLSTTAFATLTETSYQDFAREDDTHNAGLRFAYRLSRSLTLGLEGRRVSRSSTDTATEFTEKRGLLTLLYSSGPLYTPIMRR